MNREEALTVKLGDRLILDPAWNNSTVLDKLTSPVPVMLVDSTGQTASQTGVLILVQSPRRKMWLDAGWFEAPEK